MYSKELNEDILQKLHSTFSTRIMHNISIDEISEIIGISKRTYYNHFSTKEDCLLKAREYALKKLQEDCTRIFMDNLNVPKTALYRVIEREVEFIVKDKLLCLNVRTGIRECSLPEVRHKLFENEIKYGQEFKSFFCKALKLYRSDLSDEEIDYKFSFIGAIIMGIAYKVQGTPEDLPTNSNSSLPFDKMISDIIES